MKKVLNLFLIITLGILTFPTDIFALKQDVGVNVKGDISISAVTTISSDITIDVVNRTTSDAYIELQNKSSIPLDVKVTDIEPLTQGAPSTFVDDELLANAGVEDTKNKIGFSIDKGLAYYENPSAILPDTEVDLGVVLPYSQGLGSVDSITETLDNAQEIQYVPYDPYYAAYISTGLDSETFSPGSEIYRLSVNNGYAWTESDLNFYYGITMVVGAAETNYDRNPIPELGVDGINVALLSSTNTGNSYLEIYFDGLTEEKSSSMQIYHEPLSYIDFDGNSKDGSLTPLGRKVWKQKEWDEESQSWLEVPDGEVYGISYFYDITLADNYNIQYAQKPLYFHLNFSIVSSELSEEFYYTDVITNKSLNS